MLAEWETIRKFVVEKGRDFRQRRQRIAVEEDGYDQPPSNSDVPPRLTEPQWGD
jgi:hypothetical protein